MYFLALVRTSDLSIWINKLLEYELECVDLKLTSFMTTPGGELLLLLHVYTFTTTDNFHHLP